jgi:hypothetical protein
MPKLTPKRPFLLRIENGNRIRAQRGVKIDVTDEEHKKFFSYFKEKWSKKKGALSVR